MNTILELVSLKQVLEEREGIARTLIRTPEDLGDVARHFIGDEDREIFLVIGLNTQHRINIVNRCHVGDLGSTIIHPREIFKPLILHNCSAFAISHNHPSGYLDPSTQDINVTKRLEEAGNLLGIRLIDHVIVNDRRFISLRDKGYVKG